jgi:hypothetical protein
VALQSPHYKPILTMPAYAKKGKENEMKAIAIVLLVCSLIFLMMGMGAAEFDNKVTMERLVDGMIFAEGILPSQNGSLVLDCYAPGRYPMPWPNFNVTAGHQYMVLVVDLGEANDKEA